MVRIVLCLLFMLGGCSRENQGKEYRLGLDPTWYPMQFMGREPNILGFTTELLQEISKLDNAQFIPVEISWDVVFFELKKGKFPGVLSALQPYSFNQDQYDFSPPYLLTGPVLVVREDSPLVSLDDLQGKEIACPAGTSNATILEKYPGIIVRFYNSIPKVLSEIADGTLDGAMVDVLVAQGYCLDTFRGQLKVATTPLNQEGLRLVTLHNEQIKLQQMFAQALTTLKENGTYAHLLTKWSLAP